MKKTFIAGFLIFSLTLGINAFAFEDVQPDAPYAQAVDETAKQGFFKGDDSGNFNPENTITRAEFAVLICRLSGSERTASKTRTRIFSDLDTSHWANGYIAWTEKNGIINGFDDGTFQPDGNVTQQQAAKMIICAVGKKAEAENLGGYPIGYEEVAKKLGMAQELTAEPLKRYEAATYIYNALKEEKTTKKNSDLSKKTNKEAEKNLPKEVKSADGEEENNSLTLKQEESDTCTACAITMLLRRAYFLDGKDFSGITEEAIKNDENVWLENVGLYHDITFGKYNIVKRNLDEDLDRASFFTKEIKNHPEGIIIYDNEMWHALLLTDVSGDTFYVCDPATGRITPIEETRTTEGFNAAEKINGIDSIWIVNNKK